MITIGHRDDNIAKTYSLKTRKCETIGSLQSMLKADYPFLIDAIEQSKRITSRDWEWVKRNARIKKHAVKINELAGAILMPKKLIKMSILSNQLKVPEGCVLIRLLEQPETSTCE